MNFATNQERSLEFPCEVKRDGAALPRRLCCIKPRQQTKLSIVLKFCFDLIICSNILYSKLVLVLQAWTNYPWIIISTSRMKKSTTQNLTKTSIAHDILRRKTQFASPLRRVARLTELGQKKHSSWIPSEEKHRSPISDEE